MGLATADRLLAVCMLVYVQAVIYYLSTRTFIAEREREDFIHDTYMKKYIQRVGIHTLHGAHIHIQRFHYRFSLRHSHAVAAKLAVCAASV